MQELNNKLRLEVRLLKAIKNIKYTEMLELLDLSSSGFNQWRNNYFDLSEEKLEEIQAMIDIYK